MKRPILLFALGFLGLVLFPSVGWGQNPKLQSAFVFQFARLIEWCPDMRADDFTIGYVGVGEVKRELERLTSRKVGKQTVRVKSFKDPSQVSACNILFVPSHYASQLPSIRKRVAGTCTLIICNKLDSYLEGAGISFRISGMKLEYDVNRSELTALGLKPSSDLLLRFASNVK